MKRPASQPPSLHGQRRAPSSSGHPTAPPGPAAGAPRGLQGFSPRELGLFTDLYELLMAQGDLLQGRQNEQATFDYFFRSNPYGGGYVVFAGLQNLLTMLGELRFTADDIDYLRGIGFSEQFLSYLSTFRFRGAIRACREGEVVFPLEPVAVVSGNLIEVQLIETLLLNTLNFESLIATKASRIREAAGSRVVAEFGLRRAQGLAGLQASRAAAIGGVDSTSNVLAGKLFGIPVSGTQAHSWVQSFDSELEAFRGFARQYPDRCTLLVDTYDTLRSGIPNAITVAREMEARGEHLAAVRLDSGDLAFLSKRARQMLDEAGLQSVKIVASNRLDERVIRSLLDQGAPIDIFGVGTALAAGQPDAALDGVYKLSAANGTPRMKVSDNPEKMSLPGEKKIIRFLDGAGYFMADAIMLRQEESIRVMHHPFYIATESDVEGYAQELLLEPAMDKGEVHGPQRPVAEIRGYAASRLAKLHEAHRRFDNPHIYRVGISPQLLELRTTLAGRRTGKK